MRIRRLVGGGQEDALVNRPEVHHAADVRISCRRGLDGDRDGFAGCALFDGVDCDGEYFRFMVEHEAFHAHRSMRQPAFLVRVDGPYDRCRNECAASQFFGQVKFQFGRVVYHLGDLPLRHTVAFNGRQQCSRHGASNQHFYPGAGEVGGFVDDDLQPLGLVHGKALAGAAFGGIELKLCSAPGLAVGDCEPVSPDIGAGNLKRAPRVGCGGYLLALYFFDAFDGPPDTPTVYFLKNGIELDEVEFNVQIIGVSGLVISRQADPFDCDRLCRRYELVGDRSETQVVVQLIDDSRRVARYGPCARLGYGCRHAHLVHRGREIGGQGDIKCRLALVVKRVFDGFDVDSVGLCRHAECKALVVLGSKVTLLERGFDFYVDIGGWYVPEVSGGHAYPGRIVWIVSLGGGL